MTIGVLVHHDVSPERIRQIIPVDERTCQIQFVDGEGFYVHGLVMCSAESLRVIADSAAEVGYTTADAYRACAGMDG